MFAYGECDIVTHGVTAIFPRRARMRYILTMVVCETPNGKAEIEMT